MLEEKEAARQAKKAAEDQALKDKAASGVVLSNKERRALAKLMAEEERAAEEAARAAADAAAGELRNFVLEVPNDNRDHQSIHVEGFSMHVCGKSLFTDANLKINNNQRYGLHGPNGKGKTSLLKHIAQRKFPTPDRWDIFCVDQEAQASEASVVDEVLNCHQLRNNLLAEEEHIMHQIRESNGEDGVAQLVDRLQTIDLELDSMGSEQMEAEVRKILAGLGFSIEAMERSVSTFSGGWRMRVRIIGFQL